MTNFKASMQFALPVLWASVLTVVFWEVVRAPMVRRV